MEFIYRGVRHTNGRTVVTVDGAPLPFDGRHSPTGLEWGYQGSGPAELARAILTHHNRGEPVAPTVYQHFKAIGPATWKADRWTIATSDIDDALRAIRSTWAIDCVLCADTGRREVRGHWSPCRCRRARATRSSTR